MTARSLAAKFPKLAKEYHSLNPIPATELAADAPTAVLWECAECKSTWTRTVFERTVVKSECPGCSSSMSVEEASPLLAQELHPTKNDPFLTPRRLTVNHRGQLWWRCSACQGEFQTSVKSRIQSSTTKGSCPHCRVKGDVSSQEILNKEWHPTKNGDLQCQSALNAPQASKLSKQLAWWICPACALEWQAAVAS